MCCKLCNILTFQNFIYKHFTFNQIYHAMCNCVFVHSTSQRQTTLADLEIVSVGKFLLKITTLN